ncbi:MAG: hypothetical protein HQK70_13850 [Desulfamplus sp.]|nr:hypothetical protein [Desulfamplus sp.]
MVAIYLTGITIAMLNITGIGFVIFMLLFNHQSTIKLKKSNLKKSSTLNSTLNNSIENSTDKLSTIEEKDNRAVKGKSSTETVSAIAAGIALAGGADGTNSNINKKSGDFDNIDDILNDLDLSDFDNLDLDDFN